MSIIGGVSGIISGGEEYVKVADLLAGYRLVPLGELDKETLEDIAQHLERHPSFGDGTWAARIVRALATRPGDEGESDG